MLAAAVVLALPATAAPKPLATLRANLTTEVPGPGDPNGYGHAVVKVYKFFLSSRRRHTRSLCDWSSDVCSSDLCRHMETWVTDLAAERRYTLIDRARVQIAGDPTVPRRSIRVHATIADRPGLDRDTQDAVQRTEVYRVLRAATGIPPLRLRISSGADAGKELFVRKATTTIGRALDNDMIFEAGEVSRYHARLDYIENAYRLTDLGSTNGTKVNGVSIGISPVITG